MKRHDLQAIRGVAILLVLIFHLQPKQFSLGFIGVDMFFVLSGYLMAMILSKSKLSFLILADFYTRRFRRIVPLMYFIVLLVYISCAFLLFGPDKDQLKIDIQWSLSFLSNIQPLYEVKGYWDQVVSYRFLVHCWSLGIEIQFYLIAPFIILITNQLSPLIRQIVLSLLIGPSLVFQLESNEKISYGLLPSRIWQFLLGCLVFAPKRVETPSLDEVKLLEDGEEKKPPIPMLSKISEPLMILCIVAVLFNLKQIFPEPIMRIFGTLVVAISIGFPSSYSISLMENRLLVYLGDISYIMYLIHWPIIVSIKYILDQIDLDLHTTFFVFGIIILSSIFLHHGLEKFLISRSLKTGICIVLACSSVFYVTFPSYDKCCSWTGMTQGNENIDINKAIAFNTHESSLVYFKLPCERDTWTLNFTNNDDKEPQLRCQIYGNGTAKILVMGNSIAYRAFSLVHKVLKGRFKELRLYSRSSRPVLIDHDPAFTKQAKTLVDRIRPDIIWSIYSAKEPMLISPFNTTNKENDSAYSQLLKNINFYKNRTKIFLIDLPYYWDNRKVAYEITKRLRQGKSLLDLKVSKEVMIKQQEDHRQRILAVKCENCWYLNIEERMLDHGFYYLYNPKNYHAYSKDGSHFTWDMLDRLEPLYQKTIDKALKQLKL